jgi:hypothetical protein
MSVQHLLRNAKLPEVSRIRRMPERALGSLARERDAAPILDFVRMIRDAVDDLEVASVRDVLEQRVLAPAEDDVPFELLVGFGIVDGLLEHGFLETQTRLVERTSVPFAILKRRESRVTMWWRRALWRFSLTTGATSQFHRVLELAGMSRSSLRPDFLLVGEDPDRLLIVEIKHTVRDNASSERDGIRDALAYLDDAREGSRICQNLMR